MRLSLIGALVTIPTVQMPQKAHLKAAHFTPHRSYFSRIYQLSATAHAPCDMTYLVLSGACNPMLCAQVFTGLPQHGWQESFFASLEEIGDPKKALVKWIRNESTPTPG